MTKPKEETSSNKIVFIRQLWANNLEDKFNLVRGIVHIFRSISMDTEFPRVIHAPKIGPRHVLPPPPHGSISQLSVFESSYDGDMLLRYSFLIGKCYLVCSDVNSMTPLNYKSDKCECSTIKPI